MSDAVSSPPPAAARGLLGVASLLVPGAFRAEWRARRRADLQEYWDLYRRGDAPWEQTPFEYCSGMFAHAFAERFPVEFLRRAVLRPRFVVLGAMLAFLLTGLLTHGFSATLNLLYALISLTGKRPHDTREGVAAAHVVLISFALLVAIRLVALTRPPLHRYGWRYWSFLFFKLGATLVLVPVLWIETTFAVRAFISNASLSIILGGLLPSLIFIAALGCAITWCFSDQRRRCPVCLRRLSLPVTTGSWSSMFEPASTEFLCEEGHGSLILPENVQGHTEHWTSLGSPPPPRHRPGRTHK